MRKAEEGCIAAAAKVQSGFRQSRGLYSPARVMRRDIAFYAADVPIAVAAGAGNSGGRGRPAIVGLDNFAIIR